jgi:hypothetical protein
MTTGLQPGQSSNGRFKVIRLLEAATATNSPPSGSSAGVATTVLDTDHGSYFFSPEATLIVRSTAGSDTMNVTIRLWGYDSLSEVWLPLGSGGDSTKGIINDGASIGETGSNTIRHAEIVDNWLDFDRLYPEITVINGTGTAITVELKVRVMGGH